MAVEFESFQIDCLRRQLFGWQIEIAARKTSTRRLLGKEVLTQKFR